MVLALPAPTLLVLVLVLVLVLALALPVSALSPRWVPVLTRPLPARLTSCAGANLTAKSWPWPCQPWAGWWPRRSLS